MSEIANLILMSGKAGIELALFVLLPVMIVMLTFMRLLEARGVLDWIVKMITPVLRPFGIPGLGVFALFQTIFVSFAAPMATLAIMDKSDITRRHIAATLAMVFTCAQANVTFPMAAVGLDSITTIIISIASGIIAAAVTYYLFARNLPEHREMGDQLPIHPVAESTKGILDIINSAGKEAFNLSISALPMLVLALLLVNTLRIGGTVEWLESLLTPVFNYFGMSVNMLLPMITKAIAGGTAMMGVAIDSLNQGLITTDELNKMASFLISPFDLAGIAILISAGKRVAAVIKPAIYGALIGMSLRVLMHAIIY